MTHAAFNHKVERIAYQVGRDISVYHRRHGVVRAGRPYPPPPFRCGLLRSVSHILVAFFFVQDMITMRSSCSGTWPRRPSSCTTPLGDVPTRPLFRTCQKQSLRLRGKIRHEIRNVFEYALVQRPKNPVTWRVSICPSVARRKCCSAHFHAWAKMATTLCGTTVSISQWLAFTFWLLDRFRNGASPAGICRWPV